MSSQDHNSARQALLEKTNEALFQHAPDGIVLVDANNGQIIECNQGFEKLAGRMLPELQKMKIWELRPTGERQKARAVFESLLSREVMSPLETSFLRPDNTILPIEFLAWRIELDGHVYVQSISRDISARKQSEQALRKSEARYQAFFDHAPDMYFIVGPDGIVKTVNLFGAQYLGYTPEQLIGNEVWKVVHPDDLDSVKAQVAQIFEERMEKSYLKFRKIRADESVLYVHENTQLTLNASGDPEELLIICRDISEQVRAQKVLRESEQRYYVLFEDAPTPLFEIDMRAIKRELDLLEPDSHDKLMQYLNSTPSIVEKMVENFHILNINKAALDLVNAKNKSELISRLRQCFTDESLDALKNEIAEAYHGQTGSEIETVIRALTGDRLNIILKWTVVPGHEQTLSKVFISAVDITERKRTHEELERSEVRLRALAGHLHNITERERISISRDLHDGIGGTLTSLKIDLTMMERRLKSQSKMDAANVLDNIKSMKNLIDSTVDNVRHFVRELRPELLDNFGLSAALEWQSQEFGKRTGLHVDYHADSFGLDRDDRRSIAIFRIFQEALTNIARHAKAKKVIINLSQNPDGMVVEIRDDGIGIPMSKLDAPDTFGLLGMKERARMIDADLQIQGKKDEGTSVKLLIRNPTIPGHD